MLRGILQIVLALSYTAAAFTSGACEAGGLQAKEIRIFGNEKIKSYIIAREIPFQAGDNFDSEMLRRARERILAIPGVDYSEIRVGYVPLDSMTIVSVVITEKPTLRGYLLNNRGYENKISFGIKAEENNFRGRSETLYALGMIRGNTVFGAGWNNPWIAGALRLGIGVGAFYKKYRYVYDDAGTGFADAEIERIGAAVSLSHPLGRYQRIALEGGFESVSSPVAGITIDEDRDSYLTGALAFTRDSRRSRAFPWDASFVEARAEWIGPGDESFSLFEGTVDARKYISFFSRTVMALQGVYRVRDGETIPIYRREHIGGARTLRGYDYGAFNGVNSLLGGVEYRIPFNFSKDEPVEDLLLGISLQLFAEAGTAWENHRNYSSDLMHGSFGAGVSLLTVNAAGIRFDYAWHRNSSGRWEIDAGLKF
jgi:outer membrane protein insertion porin family